ncbi:MarR family winged helix-turn-helix transcriptional regulator [Salinarimonas sp.]|uniref:MarR family winged helix-turn-helix transcriptional regulator n=1 Tax=Salinarimonas sp. TaxID=2766526 RepID=UPI00391A21D6
MDDVVRLENQLCFAVYAASHAFNAAYTPLLEPLGLTYPQYLVLMTLWEEDGRTVSGIGEPLDLDSGTLTPLLKRMEAAGLVRRARDPDDERRVRVFVTPKGRALERDATEIQRSLSCVVGGAEDAAALRTSLEKLTQCLRGIGTADAPIAIEAAGRRRPRRSKKA